MSKRYGLEFWRGHLEAWHRGDLSQRDYCAKHGLSVKTFCRWRGKEKAAAKSSLTLVPASVGASSMGHAVRLRSPGGWQVEMPGASMAKLAELLRQLP
jgi:hypothetical protein